MDNNLQQTPSAPAAQSADDRKWAVASHLCGLLWLFGSGGLMFWPFGLFGLAAMIAPFIIWHTKGQSMPFVAEQARESLNFQITVFLLGLVCILLMLVLIGFLMIWVLGVLNIIFVIIAAVTVNDGKPYRYPFAWRIFN
jgi:uncharacterized protein